MITSTSEKGRVAVMCCGHKEYWPQFPGMREEVINYMNEIAGYVQSSQAELLESRFVDNIDDSIAYGRDLKAKGCDLLILYVPAYIASGRYMQGVIAAGCPVVVVGMQKAYILPERIQRIFGERNRNIYGSCVKFNPIGGNTIHCSFGLIIKEKSIHVIDFQEKISAL